MIFISFNLSISAEDYDLSNSYFNHLSKVNKEWFKHRDVCPQGTISFSSDTDRIQLHLNLVIQQLKSIRPRRLNSAQIANRLFLLDGLQQYVDKKIFPINKYHVNRQPYFVDNLGTNCAVGQMIYLSGDHQLLAKVSKDHNYDYIENISTDGLKEWATEFGFTLEELKWIQPAYMPIANMEQVLGGTNGSVNKIEFNYWDESLTIAGDFTELNNLPCVNIGVYLDDQLNCLGTGVDGTINDIIHLSGVIYVFGELNYNGEIYAGAMYDGSSWIYLNIPNREGAICTSANQGGVGYQFEMAISHNSIPGQQEIWHFLEDNTWEKKAMVKGVILDIIGSSYGRVHVGHLDSVIVYDSNNEIDTSLTVNNVLFKANYSDLWFGISDDISDTVNVVVNIGGAIIFGGTCSNQVDLNTICISRYFNSTLQPLYVNDYGNDSYSINTIAYDSGNKFVFGGDFDYSLGLTNGSHLATYDIVSNRIEPIAIFDKAVNTLSYLDSELFIGGSFQTNLDVHSINFLARQRASVGVSDLASDEEFDIYPNPFTTSIHLDGVENGIVYSILSFDGRHLKSGQVMNETINDLDFLRSGFFLLRLESSDGFIVKKIIK
ncbi:hypothetical protein GCM10007940_36630 [Portibacter lacus]|uniref:Secretion system C-terminal sorting domain-containing protein n=2 Tax=Portibacter lacus TaxID=1099794 RepID=A0AA37WFV5_9BACT|nr:hypothetical protein GCM10007940_36630 [Portibacter lacus]